MECVSKLFRIKSRLAQSRDVNKSLGLRPLEKENFSCVESNLSGLIKIENSKEQFIFFQVQSQRFQS